MKLSRTSAYAIRAAVQLAQSPPGVPVSSRQLAEDGQMPVRFLLQVLAKLTAVGLLKSARGVDGGFVLQRETKDISLLEIIEGAEGPLGSSVAAFEGKNAKSLQSRLHKALERANASLRRELAKVTLADLSAGL